MISVLYELNSNTYNKIVTFYFYSMFDIYIKILINLNLNDVKFFFMPIFIYFLIQGN